MYSSLAVLICTTVLVLVQCRNHHSKEGLRLNTAMTEPQKTCHPKRGKYWKDFRTSMMNTACKPHPRHVVLKAMPGEMFSPPMVSVPRCDGVCASGLMCQPIDSQTIRVPVNVVNTSTQMMKFPHQCTFVEVEEHLACSCGCDVKESDCNPKKQEYMKSKCKCVCTDIKAQTKCEDGLSVKMWNEEKCSCDCMVQNTDCTTGQEWDEEKCMCVMKGEARRMRP